MERDHRAAGVMKLDHVAHPSYDAAATHRFYTGVLGATLDAASSGESDGRGARFLLCAYRLGEAELDFFCYPGLERPPTDGLPRDIRHVGVVVGDTGELARLRDRVEASGVQHWVERRPDDANEHLYVTDPNGLVIEFSVTEPPWAPRSDALDVLRQWTTP